MRTLKRLHYTLLRRHVHVKPALGGNGWQTINDNVFINFADDLIVYGVSVARKLPSATVRQVWQASKDKFD